MYLTFLQCNLPCIFGHKGAQGPDWFFWNVIKLNDKQGQGKQPMSHTCTAQQILTLARIHAELQDPEQTKAQLQQGGFSENDLDLRYSDTKHKYRIIIKNLLVDNFRKNLLAASESL
ncbi:MAG: hypothetical protein EZS28_042192, partial [Streblomastix strix]